MGNIGGIERVMVFGILIIIITILGIAVFSASDIEDDFAVDVRNSPIVEPLNYDNNTAFEDSIEAPSNDKKDIPSMRLGSETLVPPDKSDPAAGRDGSGKEGTPPAEEDSFTSKTVGAEPAVKEKPASKSGKRKTYIVQKGDSFAKIARKLYGSEKMMMSLVDANPDLDPLNLQVGDVINLPEPAGASVRESVVPPSGDMIKLRSDVTIYTVKKNDTLCGIADKIYGDKLCWKKIYKANRDIIPNPNDLVPGMKLRIP